MKRKKKRKKAKKRFNFKAFLLDVLKWFALTVLELIVGYLFDKIFK